MGEAATSSNVVQADPAQTTPFSSHISTQNTYHLFRYFNVKRILLTRALLSSSTESLLLVYLLEFNLKLKAKAPKQCVKLTLMVHFMFLLFLNGLVNFAAAKKPNYNDTTVTYLS